MIDKRYKIDDFDRLIYGGFEYKIDSEVTKVIQMLSDQVGDPEYIRTPQFPKQERIKKHEMNNKLYSETQNHQWDAVRNFKATQIVKQDGIEGVVNNIRKHLNKLSDKNYDSITAKICVEIEKIAEEKKQPSEQPSEQVLAECDKVGDAIFTIASGNIFYSSLYAKLLKDLMNRFTFMRCLVKKHFNNFKNIFSKIEYCSPNKDYDKYCEINKMNEKRRATSAFYVNLMKMEVIPKHEILNIIRQLQDYQTQKMNESDQIHVVNELSEVIYIMIIDSKSMFNKSLNDDDKQLWDDVIGDVETLSKMKKNVKPSLTPKSIFKNMDIWDAIVNNKN